MSADSIAKEAIRIATTAGLSKDVIDLLTTKVDLLSGEIDSLTEQLALARKRVGELGAENAGLQGEVEHLKQQLQNAVPIEDGMDGDALKILKLYYDAAKPIAIDAVAQHLGIHPSDARAHVSDLTERRLLIFVCAVGANSLYRILPAGTKYLKQNPR